MNASRVLTTRPASTRGKAGLEGTAPLISGGNLFEAAGH
jgi:hypothetical protein